VPSVVTVILFSRHVYLAHHFFDKRQHWRTEEYVYQLRIELGTASLGEGTGRLVHAASMAVAPLMRDRIEAIGDRYDPCLDGNPLALDATRVSRSIPTLVVRYHPFRQIRIKNRERR
jgi:hypothetical protein